MASRRVRIKGIANIPQRKKGSQENIISNVDIIKSEICLPEDDYSFKVKEEESANKCMQNTNCNSAPDLSDNSFKSNKELSSTHQNNVETTNKTIFNKGKHLSNILESLKTEGTESFNSSISKVTKATDNFPVISSDIPYTEEITVDAVKKTASDAVQIKERKNQNPQISVPRRNFLKPGINLSAIKKRQTVKEINERLPAAVEDTDVIKQEISNKNEETEINLKPIEKVVVLSEIIIPKYEKKTIPVARDITKIFSRQSTDDEGSLCSEVTLNETHLCANEVPGTNSSVVTFSPSIKKVIPETYNVSDSEYPAPPSSPSKINRSRIKAIPRLSHRKTSCSASESEDETKKYGRIRNNSICSVVSTSCLEPPTPTSETITPKDVTPNVPKKLNRSDQSRKLAEARREFHKRFGTKSPDKQRLKMIDLIFYNPTTNPISQKDSKASLDNNNTKIEPAGEEIVDDPAKVVVEEKEKENDTNNSMPVPQIKIGPSGEIILDEQSLIVENAEVARQKEQIRKSRIVNGDFDTGYGIYKRVPRSLSWNQKETIRFYRALNLIGTDFTVMTQLFPRRTRRELKMKFKKEEKVNKHLIDKAIMQPCNYNFTDLKREIQIDVEEELAVEKLKKEEMEKMKQVQLEKKIKREKKRKDNDTEEDKSTPEDVKDPNKDTIMLPPKKRLRSILPKPPTIKPQPRKTKAKSLNIKSVLDDDSDADISDMETQSESEEEETIPFLKPTRSGRMPKSTIRYTTIVDHNPKPYPYDTKKRTTSDVAAKQSSLLPKTFFARDELLQEHSYGAIRNRRSSSLSSLESNSDKLVPGSVVITVEEDANGKSEYKVFMVTPEKKMVPLDLNSEIVARLIKERQNDEDNVELLVPSVPEENVTIPAAEENVALKSQVSEEILIINCPDDLPD